MSKLVVCLTTQTIVRFLETGALDALEQVHEVVYAVAILDEKEILRLRNSEVGHVFTPDRRFEWLPIYSKRFQQWNELFNISCIIHRDLSSSFRVRYEQSIQGDTRLEALADAVTYPRYRQQVEARMGFHPQWLELFLNEQPDAVVLPSALLDHITDDVLQVTERLHIPTAMLLVGWDNLSSKGLLFRQPDVMGVWGEQSREHAITMQGTPAGSVQVIGAPQYPNAQQMPAVDRASWRSERGLPTDCPLVLFAGTFRMFDETTLLQRVESAINNGDLPMMHVLYRPHPWRAPRQDERDFFDLTWQHVTIDPQLAEAYRAHKDPTAETVVGHTLFRMGYLFELYQALDAVISPMSTVLLEAMLFGLPTMTIAFGDGKHTWSADKVSQMVHFHEMYAIPELVQSTQQDAFIADVKTLVGQVGDATIAASYQQQARYFVDVPNDNTYAERALALVDGVLKQSKQPSYTMRQAERWRNTWQHRWFTSRIRGALMRILD